MNKYTKKLIFFLNEKSSNGQSTITIPLQKMRKGHVSFEIHPIYKNSRIIAVNVEKRVMPADTIFSIDLFDFVLKILLKAKGNIIPKGNALNKKICKSEKTIESEVAKKFYNKKEGNHADRRISVISNIMIASGLCKSEKTSSLKLL